VGKGVRGCKGELRFVDGVRPGDAVQSDEQGDERGMLECEGASMSSTSSSSGRANDYRRNKPPVPLPYLHPLDCSLITSRHFKETRWYPRMRVPTQFALVARSQTHDRNSRN